MKETKDNLLNAEELIDKGELSEAQQILDEIDEQGAEWHFVQSKLFVKKNWHNEARKQLEIAMMLEPDNDTYKKAYEELKKDKTTDDLHEVKKKKFDSDGCAECCCMASCEVCATGICEAICDGCG